MAVFWVVALMMEAARTSETLVNFYQTTRRYNPEDSHLRTHRREDLKSYLPDAFPTQNGLKQRDALSALLFNFSLEYGIKKAHENRGTGTEWDTSASGLC
jgi:hypothetical protein